MIVRLGLNLATYPVYIYNQGFVIEKACMTEIQITPYMRRYDLFTQAVTWTRGNHHQKCYDKFYRSYNNKRCTMSILS